MEQYVFKTFDEYQQIKKLYNHDPLTVIWHDEGAPTRKIGRCMDSFVSWIKQATDLSYNSFGDYYLTNVRTLDKIDALANELEMLFKQAIDTSIANGETKFVGKESELLNHDNIVDLIILHAVIETYKGGFAEMRVKMYLESLGKKVRKAYGKLDVLFGCDLIVDNKDGLTASGIQIKPISFFLGTKPDLIKDREKVFTSFEALKNDDDFNVNRLFFVVWKEVGNEIKFLTLNDDIFFAFSDISHMMNVKWHDFCKIDECWKTI